MRRLFSAANMADSEVLNAALGTRYHLPMSEYLFGGLRSVVQDLMPEEEAYERAFDLLEYLVALAYFDLDQNWAPIGRFAYRRVHADSIVRRVAEELQHLGNAWPPLQAGFFGGSLERAKAAAEGVAGHLSRIRGLR